jgi:hypothetical protein
VKDRVTLLRIALLYSENVLKSGIEGSWILKIFKNPYPDAITISKNCPTLGGKPAICSSKILKYELEANNCNRMMVNLVCKIFLMFVYDQLVLS